MKIKVKRQVNASAEAIWEHLADYNNISKFHPYLKHSDYIEESKRVAEVGSTRQCDFNNGMMIQEEIVEWKEGSHYKINVVETNMPVKAATGLLGVRSTGENTSEVYFEFEMTPRNPLMRPMMWIQFKLIMGPKILKSLEEYHFRTVGIATA